MTSTPDRAESSSVETAAFSDAELAQLMTRLQDYADNGPHPLYYWLDRKEAAAILAALRRADRFRQPGAAQGGEDALMRSVVGAEREPETTP